MEPFFGVNSGFEAVSWLPDPQAAASMAILPLRLEPVGHVPPGFGMLVLASPDAQRFNSAMGTDFLQRIGELASAALATLKPLKSLAHWPLMTKPPVPAATAESSMAALPVLLTRAAKVANVGPEPWCCGWNSTRPRVHSSSGFDRLDDAALSAVRRWSCAPPLRNGQPVRATALQPFHFVLRGV